MTSIHPDDQAEICALWPQLSLRVIAKRFGYALPRVQAAVRARYGHDLSAARGRMGARPMPIKALSTLGVQARERGRRAAQALQQCEDQMLAFWSGI